MSNIIVRPSTNINILARDSQEILKIANVVINLVSGGKRLDRAQALELATYCWLVGANPADGEAYYLPGVGPVPGIQLYRRRADEQLRAEDPTIPPRVWFEYRPATHSEALFDEDKGDIAWVAVLHDSHTHHHWMKQQLEIFMTLTKAGIPGKEAWEIAETKVGPEPTWEAAAVVYGDEKFSREVWKDGKPTGIPQPERWDRTERCKKRAAKWALRKRFSNLAAIPDVETGEDIKKVISEISSQVEDKNIDDLKSLPEDVIIEQLGFEPAEPSRPLETAGASQRPFSPERLKSWFQERVEMYEKRKAKPAESLGHMVASQLEKLLGGKTQRYELCQWLVGKASTGEMTGAERLALREWLGVSSFDDEPNNLVKTEAAMALSAALKSSGQIEMGGVV